MNYTLELFPAARKSLERMEQAMRLRMMARLRELAKNPYDPRLSKKLRAVGGLRSSRVGDWRTLFSVDDWRRTVVVLSIRPRGEAYRDL